MEILSFKHNANYYIIIFDVQITLVKILDNVTPYKR